MIGQFLTAYRTYNRPCLIIHDCTPEADRSQRMTTLRSNDKIQSSSPCSSSSPAIALRWRNRPRVHLRRSRDDSALDGDTCSRPRSVRSVDSRSFPLSVGITCHLLLRQRERHARLSGHCALRQFEVYAREHLESTERASARQRERERERALVTFLA